ncbi:MAG: type II toxin-antitoxin system HicB family antitoxin [Nitrospirae bacterium]|nr:type II toxin-antitoxin system HicB family antitoxin [Nitrospirota bacterium]
MQYVAHFLSQPEGGYTVVFPALEGCVTEGGTFEEALANAQEAVELYLRTLMRRGKPLPQDGFVHSVHARVPAAAA